MRLISYAQNQEDIILYRALSGIQKGFYIDVGAQHPVIDSVTKLFYERGWRGINIDPVPQWFKLLTEDRPHDVNLQLAAGSAAGRTKIYAVASTGLSTSDASLGCHYGDLGFQTEELDAEVKTLDAICSEHHVTTVHFLKIDVEGAETEVLRGFAFKRVRPWVVLVEAVAPVAMQEGDTSHVAVETHAEWEPILIGHGYEHVYSDGLNRFYLAAEHEELRAQLRTPPNPLDAFVRHGELLKHERIVELETEIEELTHAVQAVDERYAIKDRDGLIETAANRLQRIAVLEQENARLIGEMSCMQKNVDELRDVRDRVALLVQQKADLANELFAQRYQVKDAEGLVETAANRLQRIAELEQDNARLIGEASVLQHSIVELNELKPKFNLLAEDVGVLSGKLEVEGQYVITLVARLEELERENRRLAELLAVAKRDSDELSSIRLEALELGRQNAVLGERASNYEENERGFEMIRRENRELVRALQSYKDKVSSSVSAAISLSASGTNRLLSEINERDARLADLRSELERSEAALQQMLGSRLWKLATPFRRSSDATTGSSQVVTKAPLAKSDGRSLPRRMVHDLLMASIRFLERHPRIHAGVRSVYRRIPVFNKHLSAFVQHNVVHAKRGAVVVSVAPDPVSVATDKKTPPEVFEAHNRIKRIIVDQQHQRD